MPKSTKYFWGNDPFPMKVIPGFLSNLPYPVSMLSVPFNFPLNLCMAVGALLGTVLFLKGPAPTGPGVTAGSLGGVGLVTLGWVWCYYNTIGHQVGLKFSNAFASHPQATTVGERCMMNTLEQGIPFLVLLWMHAIFVDVSTSVSFGWFYVVMRFLYGVFYSYYGHFTMLAELSTQPNYTALAYFTFGLVDTLYNQTKLSGRLQAMHPGLLFLAFFGLTAGFMTVWNFPTGVPMTMLNNRANPAGGASSTAGGASPSPKKSGAAKSRSSSPGVRKNR